MEKHRTNDSIKPSRRNSDESAGWRAWLASCLRKARFVISEFSRHNCVTSAAALTFTTLFAVVPLMTVSLMSLSLVPEFLALGQGLQADLFAQVLPEGAKLLQEKLVEFSSRARTLTVAGSLGMLLTSFLMLLTIEKTFNEIWEVRAPRWRLQRVLLYWSILSLGPLALIGGSIVSLYLVGLPFVQDLNTHSMMTTFLATLPFLLTALGFALLYVLVPNCHVPFRHGLVGGLLTTVALKVSFSVYTEASKNFFYDAIYGAFAALPIFLFWLYVLWVIVLAGAVVVRLMAESARATGLAQPPLVTAVKVLRVLHQAHLRGEGVTEKTMDGILIASRAEGSRVKATLRGLNAMKQDDRGEWILGRELGGLSLIDLASSVSDGFDRSQLEFMQELPALAEVVRLSLDSNEMLFSLSLDQVVRE